MPLLRLTAPAEPAYVSFSKQEALLCQLWGLGRGGGTGHNGCVFWRAAGTGSAVPTVLCPWQGIPAMLVCLFRNGHRRRACSEDLSGGLPAAVEKNTFPLGERVPVSVVAAHAEDVGATFESI